MPNQTCELKAKVLEKLEQLRAQAVHLYSINVIPEVLFDLRGQAAGQANYRANRLRFNYELLKSYKDEFVGQTVPHEFAHLVAYRIFGNCIKPHGAEWKSVMVELGAPPTRTHNYAVSPSRKLKKFLYRCNCKGASYELTSIRHNRIQRGQIYICRKCRKALFTQA